MMYPDLPVLRGRLAIVSETKSKFQDLHAVKLPLHDKGLAYCMAVSLQVHAMDGSSDHIEAPDTPT